MIFYRAKATGAALPNAATKLFLSHFMETYFNIPFEFNHAQLESTIAETSDTHKGYCCFIDSNTLVEAHKTRTSGLLDVLNRATVNSCDGSYIAMLVSFLHGKKYKAYSGPTFFSRFIYLPARHCIIGNTLNVYQKVKNKVDERVGNSDLHYIALPFRNVDDFDYESIAQTINELNPKYIWVSLGAPKQEIFMSKLLPHIEKGMMLGVGAALNYFSGEIKEIPHWAVKLHLIWFYRILSEPNKQLRRVFKIVVNYPKIFI